MHKFAILYLIIVIFLFSSSSYSNHRFLEISGLKIYSEEQLYTLLRLDRFERGAMTSQDVINAIISFYSLNGYTLVKVYIIDDSTASLRIYVDEGALGKIIFLNMDDFTTLYLKVVFRLKHKVFNYYSVVDNVEKLKKGKRWKYVTWQLKPVREYDSSILQIDRALNLEIMRKMKLVFFDRYSPRYDLIIIFTKVDIPEVDDRSLGRDKKSDSQSPGGNTPPGAEKNQNGKKKKIMLNKVDYGLKINYYNGLIPYLKYYHLGLLSAGDYFVAETSVGIMYGLDRKFKRPPRETYFNFGLIYFFTPTFKDIFTPLLRINLYQSKAGRLDLGLLEYNYLLLNVMFAPGITLLSRLNIYTGVGAEMAFLFNSKYSHFVASLFLPPDIVFGNDLFKKLKAIKKLNDFKREVSDHTEVYAYLEAGTMYDFSKKSGKVYELRKNRLKKEIGFAYDFYFLEDSFHTIKLLGAYDHEFKDHSIYSTSLAYQFTFSDTPFYHEISVSNLSFMGLQRMAYFSKHVLSQANEYRISVYKDFLYVGIFFDMTLFEGLGRNLKGAQFGFVGGPTLRVLVLDHFEFYLQYGWDYLVSTRTNQGYLFFNLYNKW